MIATVLFWAAVALVVVLLGSLAHYVYWVRRFALELPYELQERLPTADGCAVELRRLPRGGATVGPPLLLVHGLALNHRNNDLTEDLSLARYLVGMGRDVWLLTLRSGRDDLSWREERRATFAAIVRYDLAVGIDAVLERTGADELDYVGFSMGGMAMYAAAGRTVGRGLRRVAFIGSPSSIELPLAILSKVAQFVPSWLVPTLRLRIVGNFVAFAAGLVHTPIHAWIYNRENMDPGLPAVALVNGFVNIPSGLAAELVAFAKVGGRVTFDGEPILESVRSLGIPALFIAGADDRLAPLASVRRAYEAWGADRGTQKEFRVAGIEAGAAADYGHGDLAIGRFADQDVFEPVHEFFAAPRLEKRERPDDELP